MYLYWYFSELFLQQYKCKILFFDSIWEFLSLWCVWVNSLFYHHRYSRVSWMVTFWCPQQHQPDEPGLPPEPWQPGAWWAANKSAAHSGKYNHLFRKHEKTWRNTKYMVIKLYLRGKQKNISWILGTVSYRSVETQPYMKYYFKREFVTHVDPMSCVFSSTE